METEGAPRQPGGGREGLGRGIDDIAHLFLSARRKAAQGPAVRPPDPAEDRAGPTDAPPREPGGTARAWPMIRAGEQDTPPSVVWQMGRRLRRDATHVLSIAVGPETTEVRWLGSGDPPPAGSATDLVERVEAAVVDLTDAGESARNRIAGAAGELVLVTSAHEADALATYALIKHLSVALADVALGLAVAGPPEEAHATRNRLQHAASHFLNTDLLDWRERGGEPGEPDAERAEPPVIASWPTDLALGPLCGLAAEACAAEPASAPASAPVPPGPPRPLLVWPKPDLDLLADFVEQHPHLVQPDLQIMHRGLHDAGEGLVDLLGVNDAGRPTVVLVSLAGDAKMLAAALATVRWCLREAALIERLDGRLRIAPATPPRVVLAAAWFDEDLAEAARVLNRPPVSLVELRSYEMAGEYAVALARVA